MRRSKFNVALVLLGLLLTTRAARGCSCAGTTVLVDEFAKADVVFAGTVQDVDLNWRYYLPMVWAVPLKLAGFDVDPPDEYQASVLFEVTEPFKGVDETAIALSRDLRSAQCGIRWEKGWKVIVYAYFAPASHPPVATDSCTRTMFANEEELTALRSIAKRDSNDKD